MRFCIRHNDKHRDAYKANAITVVQSLDPAKDWQVEIKPLKEPYSDEQRAALWGLAYRVIADHTGLQPDDIHEFMLGEYYGWNIRDVMGRKISTPQRTTTTNERGERDIISKIELADYFTFIQARAAGQGIQIPDPDPMWKMRIARGGSMTATGLKTGYPVAGSHHESFEARLEELRHHFGLSPEKFAEKIGASLRKNGKLNLTDVTCEQIGKRCGVTGMWVYAGSVAAKRYWPDWWSPPNAQQILDSIQPLGEKTP